MARYRMFAHAGAWLFGGGVCVMACGRTRVPDDNARAASASTAPATTGLPSAAPPTLAERAVHLRINAQLQCAGEMSRIETYRDASGKVVRYIHYGALGVCSHPPAQVFTAEGKLIETIGEHPLRPGEVVSPEQTFDYWTRGLTMSSKVYGKL